MNIDIRGNIPLIVLFGFIFIITFVIANGIIEDNKKQKTDNASCIDGELKAILVDFDGDVRKIIKRVGPDNIIDVDVGYGSKYIKYVEVCN